MKNNSNTIKSNNDILILIQQRRYLEEKRKSSKSISEKFELTLEILKLNNKLSKVDFNTR